MSDPLEQLGRGSSDVRVPPTDVIKQRASRIQARRRALVGASAAVTLAAVGLVAVLAGDTPETTRQLAGRAPTPTAQSAASSVDESLVAADGEQTGEGAGGAAATSGSGTAPAADTEAGTADGAARSGSAGGRAPASDEALEVTLQVRTSASKEQHALMLKACNTNDQVVEVTFSSSQRYDFEVRRGDQLVWKWSSDKGFAQVVGTESWAPGACREWTETWHGERTDGKLAEPGDYSAVGVLASSPERRTEPVPVCRVSCL